MEILITLGGSLIAIALLYQVTQNAEDDFQEWFTLLLDLAKTQGYTQEQLNEFQELDWMIYYHDSLTPEEALIKHSYENSCNR